MQAGLDVFAIDSPEHKELKDVERDLNLMEQVIHGLRLPEYAFSHIEPACWIPSNRVQGGGEI